MSREQEAQLLLAATAAGTTSQKELANFMAQTTHESCNLSQRRSPDKRNAVREWLRCGAVGVALDGALLVQATLLCLVPCIGWAQAPKQTIPPSSLCTLDEHTVFSCVLRSNKKKVSLCAAKDLSRFYYAYGRSGAPEFIFPPKIQSDKNIFSRSHLVFAGGTGGYTYSFINNNFKYIIYSISGPYNHEDQGLIVQNIGNLRIAQKNMSCQRVSVFELHGNAVRDIIYGWPRDTDIEAHGLPHID